MYVLNAFCVQISPILILICVTSVITGTLSAYTAIRLFVLSAMNSTMLIKVKTALAYNAECLSGNV